MKDKNIYTDKIRVTIILIVHLLFIGFLIALLIYNEFTFGYNLIITLVTLLFVYAAYKEALKLFNSDLLYSITSNGISDYTVSGSTVSIKWEQVIRAEMITDSSNYQIAIIGEDDAKDYTYILINRYSFRWSQFKEIWEQIKYYSKKHKFEIVDNTPLVKK